MASVEQTNHKRHYSELNTEDPSTVGIELTNLKDAEQDVEAANDSQAEHSHSGNIFTKMVEKAEIKVGTVYSLHKGLVWTIVKVVLLSLFLGFLFYVLTLDFQRALPLFLITLCTFLYFLTGFLWHRYGQDVEEIILLPMKKRTQNHKKTISLLCNFLMVAFLVTVLTASGVFTLVIKEPIRLVSLAGLLLLLIISFLASKYPSQINWKTVTWGLYLQIILGIFVLRTRAGFILFQWIGLQVETFLNYALVGALFVFGPEPLHSHLFALVVLPVVIFASAIFALLFYFGIMQKLISGFAWLMHRTMGISGVEAFGAAANVFLGMTIVPLCIKPYLQDMTTSEIHSIMVGGFATIAGAVLAAYVNMGISAAHLLTASIMSAPAALAVAKMFYPETERPKTSSSSNIKVDIVKEQNCIESFCNGAIDGTRICGYIIGNLIAMISFLKFIDMTLLWIGHMADIDDLSFTRLCSYLLYPFAFFLGVEGHHDCLSVAGLIGTKTFLNEFVAFSELKDLIKEGSLSTRSQVIATYALCGFSNFSSVGILIGGLAPLVPGRISEISGLGVRALIAASIACQMTACIAGIMYDESTQHFNIEQNITTSPGDRFTTEFLYDESTQYIVTTLLP